MVRAQAVASAPQQPASASQYVQHVQGPIILNGQVLHSITAERLDVVRSLEDGYLQTQVSCKSSQLSVNGCAEDCVSPTGLLKVMTRGCKRYTSALKTRVTRFPLSPARRWCPC